MRVGNDGIMRRYRSMVNANASDPLSSTTWEEQPAMVGDALQHPDAGRRPRPIFLAEKSSRPAATSTTC
ncbi:tail protein [Pseudomonas phage WP1]